MSIGILLTAAGRSQRYILAGGNGNKLNAAFRGKTLFEHTLHQALLSALPIHVVTRPDNFMVQRICASQKVPVTLLESQGLGESIATGVAATANWAGWLIQLADMPFVPPMVFCQVAQALLAHDIVRPYFSDAPGHPVGFSAKFFSALCRLHGDKGACALLRYHQIHKLFFNSMMSGFDIDLPCQLLWAEEGNDATI